VQRRDSPGRSQLAGREATLGLGVQRLAHRFFFDRYRCYVDSVGYLRWMDACCWVWERDMRSCALFRVHVRWGGLLRR
jgi:hypothetical protein